MPTFTAEISFKKIDEKEMTRLVEDLKKHRFFEKRGDRKQNIPKMPGKKIRMVKHAESISEIISQVIKAVKRSSSDFAFTVMKDKN